MCYMLGLALRCLCLNICCSLVYLTSLPPRLTLWVWVQTPSSSLPWQRPPPPPQTTGLSAASSSTMRRVGSQSSHTLTHAHTHTHTHTFRHMHVHMHILCACRNPIHSCVNQSATLNIGSQSHAHARTHARTHTHKHAHTHTHISRTIYKCERRFVYLTHKCISIHVCKIWFVNVQNNL